MARKLLAAVGLLVGVVVWGVGAWQVYVANTLLGAIVALVGVALILLSIAWWRRDPDLAFDGLLNGILELLGRAR